jgi:hypothetical protein
VDERPLSIHRVLTVRAPQHPGEAVRGQWGDDVGERVAMGSNSLTEHPPVNTGRLRHSLVTIRETIGGADGRSVQASTGSMFASRAQCDQTSSGRRHRQLFGAVKRAKKLPDSPPTGIVLHDGGRAASKWRRGSTADHIAQRPMDGQTTHTIQAGCRKCRSVT